MYGPARLVLGVAIALLAGNHAYGQVNSQPTADPIVTAQNEAWYLNGNPVTFAGNIYYPTGPQVYFNRYEMVRSGFFEGVPLYTRTTIEPYSLVFVPIGGGLMQPYERRRAGDVAGTVGSTTPSFPVVVPSEQGAGTTGLSSVPPQAAAPPTMVGTPDTNAPGPPVSMATPAAAPPRAVGTTGRVVAPQVARPMRTAERPRGLNGVFVEFERARWFNTSQPVERGAARLDQVGEYHGLPVFARPGDRRTIYIPVRADSTLLTPYSRR